MMKKIYEIEEGEKPLDNIKETCGFASILKKVGVIGDSLSSGEFESTDDKGDIIYNDMYEYSWPSILSKLTGSQYLNFSRGGMTFKEFYETRADKNNFWIKCPAYIIFLGNNDLFVYNQKVGSVSDINLLDPSKNPDTYFGYMGKVISKLKSLENGARIFLTSIQIDEMSEERTRVVKYVSEEMKKVVKLYSFTYLIDFTQYLFKYDEEARKKIAMGFHPSPLGYYSLALAFGNYIDYIIRQNPEDFRKMAFVGTDLINTNYPDNFGK